jgi:hypothetical protein
MTRAPALLKQGRSDPTPAPLDLISMKAIDLCRESSAIPAEVSAQTLMGVKWSVLYAVSNRTHQATLIKEGSRYGFRRVRPLTLSSLASAAQLLEREAIYSPIGAYVEPIFGRDQCLEMMKPGHCGN